MSRTFSTSCGSVESLKLSLRCGRRPKARQMRFTAIRLIPARLAISRVLQWVAPLGAVSSVRITTCSTCSSVILRGAPGRGSSSKPSKRWATNRCRHLPTVTGHIRSSCATVLLSSPAAQRNTMRARTPNCCDTVPRRAQRSSAARSSSLNTNSAFGRPVRMLYRLT
jgi:hypothetical protein